MQNIVSHNVDEIPEASRRSLENLLGHELQQNQRVCILVLDPVASPTDDQRCSAAKGLRQLIAQVESHANEQGIREAEVDAAVEEALAQVRRRTT